MNFTIALCCPPQTPCSRRALRFTTTLLEQGHCVERLFFYEHGVYHAMGTLVTAQDEVNTCAQWERLINQHQLDAVVCIAAAIRRGVLTEAEAKRHQKKAFVVAHPWQLSGLGQLHEAIQVSDRFICFGGEA